MIAALVALLLGNLPMTEQEILDRISVNCGLKRGDITIDEGKLVRIRPSGTLTYEAVMCTLPKLKEAGFATKIGFISEPPAQQKK